MYDLFFPASLGDRDLLRFDFGLLPYFHPVGVAFDTDPLTAKTIT